MGIFCSVLVLSGFHLTKQSCWGGLVPPSGACKLKCRQWSLKAEPAQLQDHHTAERLAVFQLSFLYFIPRCFADFHMEAIFPLGLYQMLEILWIEFRHCSEFTTGRAWFSLLIAFLSKNIRNRTQRKLFHNLNVTFYKTTKTIMVIWFLRKYWIKKSIVLLVFGL